LTDRIAEKILSKVYGNAEKMYMLKQEVMHAVFCHDEAYNCLTFEAAAPRSQTAQTCRAAGRDTPTA
jgi:Uncharacterized conserved protein